MTLLRIYYIAVMLITNVDFRLCQDYAVRQTEYGKIMGIVKEVIPGKSVEMFLGVPYASPPVGDLRFEYTKAPEPWMETINTTSLPPACPQHFNDLNYLQIHAPGFNRTSEDCLYLNVYVPKHQKSQDTLSTFIWIHGGSNEHGMGAMLSGEVLAAYGEIIVVSFNYRLGNLGFLQLDSKLLPGSFGLVDQIEAIKWVNRNIQYFDGDAGKVTLAGHSAGAADVGIHMLNPNLEGLFRHAIVMSGSPLSYWAIMNNKIRPTYQKKVEAYLKSVGCLSGEIAQAKRCLKSKNASELNKYLRITVPQMLVHPMSVDNVTLFDLPINILEEGKFSTKPLLLGFTRDEGAMIAEANPDYPWMLYDYALLKKTIRDYRRVMEFSSRFEEIVAHEYMNYSVQEEYEACVQAYVQIESDTSIKVPTLHLARQWLEQTERQNKMSKIFLYSFEFENEDTFETVFYKVFGKPAVPHGQDLFYVFGIPLIGHSRYNFTSADVKLSKHMMAIWAKFVKTGDLSKADYEVGESYSSFDDKSKDYMKISNNRSGYKIETVRPYNMRAYDFWTRVELLFLDWTSASCNNSTESHSLDLTLLTFICLIFYMTSFN